MLSAIKLAKYYVKNLLSYKDDGLVDIPTSIKNIEEISPAVSTLDKYLQSSLNQANALGANEDFLAGVLLNAINVGSLSDANTMAKNQVLINLSYFEPKALDTISFKSLPFPGVESANQADVYVHGQLAAILPQLGPINEITKPLLEYSRAVANEARLKDDFKNVIEYIKDGGLANINDYIEDNGIAHQDKAMQSLIKCIQDSTKAKILAKDVYTKALVLVSSDASKEMKDANVDKLSSALKDVSESNDAVLKDFYTLRQNLDMGEKVSDLLDIKETLSKTLNSLHEDIKEGKLTLGEDFNELIAGVASKDSLYINTEDGSLAIKLSPQDLAKADQLAVHNVAGLRFISDEEGNQITPNSIKGYTYGNAVLQSEEPLKYLPVSIEKNEDYNEKNEDINAKDFSFADTILTSQNGDKYYYQSKTGKTLKYNEANKLYLEYDKDGLLNAVITENEPLKVLKVYNEDVDYNAPVLSDKMDFEDDLPVIYVQTENGKEQLDFTAPEETGNAMFDYMPPSSFFEDHPDIGFVPSQYLENKPAPEISHEVSPEPEVTPEHDVTPAPPAEEKPEVTPAPPVTPPAQHDAPPMHEDAGPGPAPEVTPEHEVTPAPPAEEKPEEKPEVAPEAKPDEDKGNQVLPPVTPPAQHDAPPMFEEAGPGPAPEVTPAPPAEEKPEEKPEVAPEAKPDEDVDANMQVDESTKNGFYLQVSPDGKYATYGSDYVYLAGKGVDLNKAELFINDGVLQANITLKGIYSMAKDGQTQSYDDYAQGYSLSAINGVLSGLATGDVLDLRPLQGKAQISMKGVDGLTIKGGQAHENIVLDTLKEDMKANGVSQLSFTDKLEVDAKDFQNLHADKISVGELEVDGMISAANLRALDSDMVSFSGLHGGENFQPYHNDGVLNLSYDSMPYSLKLSSGNGMDHVSLGEVQSSHHGLDMARINVSGLKDVGDSISFKMQGDLVLGEQADISHTYATLGTDGILRPVDNGMSVSIYAIAAIVDRNAQSDNAVYLVQTAGRRGGDDYHILNIGEKEELSGAANDIWLMGVNKGVNLGLAVDGDTISVSVVS